MNRHLAAPNLAPESRFASALAWRSALALLLLALFSSAAWYNFQVVTQAQASAATLVNVSGRQRMLSQRTALYATQLAIAPAGEHAALKQSFDAARALMLQSHLGLTEGSAELGLPAQRSAAVQAGYFEPPLQLDTQVRAYLALLAEWRDLPAEQRRSDHPLLQSIVAISTGPLLNDLDRMVQLYQREGDAALQRLERVETGLWLASLALLALLWGLIFRPMVLRLRLLLQHLEQHRAALEEQKATLEDSVAERTAQLRQQVQALGLRNSALQQIPQGVVLTDAARRIVFVNPAYERSTGYTQAEVLGHNPSLLQGPDTERSSIQAIADALVLQQPVRITLLNYRKDGRTFWNDLNIQPVRDEQQQLIGFVGVLNDVSESKRREDRYWLQAHHDILTGLPNRLLLADRWRQAVSRCARYQEHAALLFLDLNRFKQLNDRHGHDAGDQMLFQVGTRLRALVRETDTVARYGGDEFAVLLQELSRDPLQARTQAEQVMRNIRQRLCEPYHLRETSENGLQPLRWHMHDVGIGLTLIDAQSTDLESTLAAADQAMYQDKLRSRGLPASQ